MTKETLIQKIKSKFSELGEIKIDAQIKQDVANGIICGEIDDINSICLDCDDVGVYSEKRDWFYPLSELTKRELEMVYKKIPKK